MEEERVPVRDLGFGAGSPEQVGVAGQVTAVQPVAREHGVRLADAITVFLATIGLANTRRGYAAALNSMRQDFGVDTARLDPDRVAGWLMFVWGQSSPQTLRLGHELGSRIDGRAHQHLAHLSDAAQPGRTVVGLKGCRMAATNRCVLATRDSRALGTYVVTSHRNAGQGK